MATVRTRGRAERARESAYYFRFTIAYTLLTVVAVAGIAALVIVLARPGAVRAPRWSAFVPTGSSVAKTRQIAAHVSSEYTLEAGGTIVTVVPGPLQTTQFQQTDSGPISIEVPISGVAVAADASKGKHEEGDATLFDASVTVGYQMCGFDSTGQNCGAAAGADAATLSALLRRQALEIGLYTLRYVSGTQAVLVYLPPPAGNAPPTAVLVTRRDMAQSLEHPLARTLRPVKLVLGQTAAADQEQVDKITRARLYTYTSQTLPGDGTAMLVLNAALTR